MGYIARRRFCGNQRDIYSIIYKNVITFLATSVLILTIITR